MIEFYGFGFVGVVLRLSPQVYFRVVCVCLILLEYLFINILFSVYNLNILAIYIKINNVYYGIWFFTVWYFGLKVIFLWWF